MSFFDRFRGRRASRSAQVAKERLKLLLVADRSSLSPEKLRAMREEILQVIRRYIPGAELDVQISIEQRERKHYLVANIPLEQGSVAPEYLDVTQPHQPPPTIPGVPPAEDEE